MLECLHIRPAIFEDVNRAVVLATQVFLRTYATEGINDDIAQNIQSELTPDRFSARLDDPDIAFTVAEDNGHLIDCRSRRSAHRVQLMRALW